MHGTLVCLHPSECGRGGQDRTHEYLDHLRTGKRFQKLLRRAVGLLRMMNLAYCGTRAKYGKRASSEYSAGLLYSYKDLSRVDTAETGNIVVRCSYSTSLPLSSSCSLLAFFFFFFISTSMIVGQRPVTSNYPCLELADSNFRLQISNFHHPT